MKKYMLAAVMLCALVAGITAQETTAEKVTLTADNAVAQALQTHIDVQTGKITLEQSRREYAHFWNTVLPSISAAATGSERRTWKDSDTDTLSLQAGVSANLSLDFGLASKIKSLKASYEAGKSDFDDTVRQTETAVRQSFYHLLYLKESWKSSQATLASYERQYEQTNAKAKHGVASELDLLMAQVNVETAKPDVESAEQTYINALIEFLNTIGLELEPGTEIALAGSLDFADTAQEIDAEKIVAECVEKSSEVRSLQDKLRSAELSRTSTRNSLYFPSLNLSGSVYPENYSKERKSGMETNTPNWSVSAGISLPLDTWIYGSSAHDKVAALDDTIETYRLQLERSKKTVRTTTIEKLKNIELSQKTLQARKLNVELAQKSYQMTEDAYNRGTKDLLSVQTALDKLQSARLQLRAEQYTLISNVLDLENTLSLPAGTFFGE